MKYRLVAADMDGTLLNTAGHITEATADAIRRAQCAGAIFTVSTGRPPQGIRKYRNEVELNGPVIAYNGAMILRGDTEEVLYEQGLTGEDAAHVLRLGRKFGTTMCIWAGNQLYGSPLNERVHEYKKLSGVEPLEAPSDEALTDIGVTKILWYDEPERIAELQKELGSEVFEELQYCTSKPCFLEFFSSKASKAAAMQRLGMIYDIPREEMIAIGDGENDLSMLRYAGLGVAMDNAPASVKSQVQYITKSNDEDGVGEVLDRFILQK